MKNRPKVSFVLNRDSVCAGDDVDSHERVVEVYSFTDAAELAGQVVTGYLPTVNGSNHSWTCRLNGKAIAKVSKAGIVPLVEAVAYEAENRIDFEYHAAQS